MTYLHSTLYGVFDSKPNGSGLKLHCPQPTCSPEQDYQLFLWNHFKGFLHIASKVAQPKHLIWAIINPNWALMLSVWMTPKSLQIEESAQQWSFLIVVYFFVQSKPMSFLNSILGYDKLQAEIWTGLITLSPGKIIHSCYFSHNISALMDVYNWHQVASRVQH